MSSYRRVIVAIVLPVAFALFASRPVHAGEDMIRRAVQAAIVQHSGGGAVSMDSMVAVLAIAKYRPDAWMQSEYLKSFGSAGWKRRGISEANSASIRSLTWVLVRRSKPAWCSE